MNEASQNHGPDTVSDPPTGIMLLDFGAGRILWQNPAMQALFRVSPAAFRRSEDYFLGEFRKGQPGESLQRAIELEGRTIGITVHHAAGGLGLVLAADVSEKARRQRAGETAAQMDVLDYLFFCLAHEMGNPINSIKMTLEVLLSNYDAYSTETRLEYLKSIHGEFHRLEELLKSIRSFNQFEHLTIQASDIPSLVRNLLQMLRKEIDEKGITLVVSYPDHPVRALCDPRALQQSLLNLIGNALDALAGRSDPVLSVTVERDGPVCRLRIADNGCGIPEAKRKEVFLPFYSSKPRGAGLGLTMVKKLLTRMEGAVELAPGKPHGTEALVTLPLASPHGN